MEPFKIETFLKENPGKQFPKYVVLDNEEREDLYKKIASDYNLKGIGDYQLFIELEEKSQITKYQNAEDSNFNLINLFSILDIKPLKSVYIDWYRYDKADSMDFQDLNDYFDYVWYPGPDDIAIFDKSLNWVVFVTHHGDSSYILNPVRKT